MLMISLFVGVVTGLLAARKGYNFVLWALAGGIPGLLVLAFLPFTNDGKIQDDSARRWRHIGNSIGGLISVIAIGWVVFTVSATR